MQRLVDFQKAPVVDTSAGSPGSMKRHVLFLIPTLTGGGAERVIVTLLKHLDRTRFALTLAVLDTRDAVYLSEVPKDVKIIDLGGLKVRYGFIAIFRLVWRLKPDVLFSTLGHLNLALSILRPLLPNHPRYVARETVVVSEQLQDLRPAKLWAWAYRNFYSRLDQIVCQSQDMKHDLAAHFFVPAAKLALINNPVDFERISQLARLSPSLLEDDGESTPLAGEERTIKLVAAGRLVPQKGFDLLIDAIAMSGLKHLQVTILGEGPLRASLEDYARLKGVDRQIRFLGFQNNPYAFMARADAFVLSSRYEGFPNVMLEALACGTHVIAVPAPGGTIEIARSAGGVQLASSISAEALSAELVRFAANPIKSNASLHHYSVATITREYETVLAN